TPHPTTAAPSAAPTSTPAARTPTATARTLTLAAQTPTPPAVPTSTVAAVECSSCCRPHPRPRPSRAPLVLSRLVTARSPSPLCPDGPDPQARDGPLAARRCGAGGDAGTGGQPHRAP